MINPFDWLRARTCQAVTDGFADALEAIDRGQVDRLQERLAPALAAPKPDAAEAPTDEAAVATPAARGKRGAK